jgi:hypothetical protein
MPATQIHELSLQLMTPLLTIWLVLLPLSPLRLVLGKPQNITIDDQGGDPTTGQVPVYKPANVWQNQNCAGCAIKPDANQLYNNTEMSATHGSGESPYTIDFNFNGK